MSNNNVSLEHLVLKIKKNNNSINFYKEFLEMLSYKQDFTSENYDNYTGDNLSIGLYFEDNFKDSNEEFSGLGHLAWQVNNSPIVHKLNELIDKYELEYECLGEKRQHHNQEFFTYCFYCPSGNRLELIYKP